MSNYNYKSLGEVDIIIDGNSVMYRNFDFSGNNMLYTSDGKPTVSIARTLYQIKNLYKTFKVRSITVAFDEMKVNKANIRHILYAQYKAGRPAPDPQLVVQFDYIKECLEAAEIHYIVAPELFEGDDVIGTLAYRFNKEKQRNIIVSSDKDMFQLVDDYTAFYRLSTKADKTEHPNILYTLKTSNPELNIKSLKNEYGIHSHQFADVKALTGDNGDNIPGVKGVGDKTAYPLIQKYGNLENLYENVDKIISENKDLTNTLFTKSLLEKLKSDEQMAFLSKELAMIHREIKINIQRTRGNMRSDKAYEVFKKYELNDLIKSLFEGRG